MDNMEPVTEAPESVAAEEDLSYGEIVTGQGSEPINPDTNSAPNPEPETPAAVDPEEVLIFEVDGKDVSIKRGDLANLTKFSEREQALNEREKLLNKDYTQKSQINSEFRKSIEGSFGRMPEPQELQELGKVWKAYFSNPKAQQAIDAILSGRFDQISQGQPNQSQGQESQFETELQKRDQKIAELEARLDETAQSFEQRETSKQQLEAKATWNGWAESKAKEGIKITAGDAMDQKMAPFVHMLRNQNPDWDAKKVLDEAYDYATMRESKQKIVGEVLQSADAAKKKNPPRITPKSPVKSDDTKSYAEIVREA